MTQTMKQIVQQADHSFKNLFIYGKAAETILAQYSGYLQKGNTIKIL